MTEGLRLATLGRELGIDFPSSLTAAGAGFDFEWTAEDVPAASSVFARVTLPADKYLILSNREFSSSRSKAIYKAYTGVAAGTPGDPIVIGKMRADGANASGVTGVFETGVTVGAAVPVVNRPIYGGGSGTASIGNANQEDILRIYPPGTVFTLELVNDTQNIADLHLYLTWWEVSADFLPPSNLEV